ncbi:unnamed protein product, partial [Heterotrigona itama]
MMSRGKLGRAFVGDVFNFADINCRDARGLARRQIRACFRAGCEQWRGTGERGSLDRWIAGGTETGLIHRLESQVGSPAAFLLRLALAFENSSVAQTRDAKGGQIGRIDPKGGIIGSCAGYSVAAVNQNNASTARSLSLVP